jgi:nucleoside-diphosphate-sugar epimerase
LLERREEVRALVRPGEDVSRLIHPNVEIFRGDLTDSASLEAAVCSVDRVFHCAARSGPWGPRIQYELVNVRGLKTLVEAALAAGVRRFVHVSSITVHGNDVRGTADETAPLRVEANPYSWSKVLGERLLSRMIREHRAPVTIVRPGWIYGPRSTASFARFASLIGQGKMVLIGAGHNHLPLVYVRDVAQGMLLASESVHSVGQVYLLVNDEPVTQRDYLNAIATELGAPPPSRRIPYRLALHLAATAELAGRLTRRENPPPLMRYGVNLLGGENRFLIGRARSELGFSPQFSLVQGVRQSVCWYRQTGYAAST